MPLLVFARFWTLVSPCWASPFWQLPQKEPKGLAPASGSRFARLPSFHPRSGGRRTRAIHGPLRLSRHPCRSLPSTRIPFGLLKGRSAVSDSLFASKQANRACLAVYGPSDDSDSIPLQEAERRCCAGGREAWMPSEARWDMDVPSRRPPEQHRSEGSFAKQNPDAGVAFFLVTFFLGHARKSDSPSRAKPMLQPTRKQALQPKRSSSSVSPPQKKR